MSDSTPRVRPTLELIVPEGPALRLDVFLAHSLAGHSRRQARELADAGLVRVNGRRARKGQPVFPKDVVRVAADPRQAVGPAPEPELPVRILHQDDAIIAIDKPAGMPTHARRPDDRGTVANFLVGRFPETQAASPNPLEAGLVHRLDSGTSGVIIAARTRAVYAVLRRAFRERAVRKEYLALVSGDVARPGRIEAPIAHLPRHPRRMRVCPNPESAQALKARAAVTFYRPVQRFGSVTLLAVHLRTGVRHQIRVHLASIGHPVVGDRLYGRDAAELPRSSRLLLHAHRVQLRHPGQRPPLAVEAPVPADFQSVLDALSRPTGQT